MAKVQTPLLIFAHGAGAGPQSDFMQHMADLLTQQGLAVVRFEFPYWSQVRETGRKRPPNKAEVLDRAMQEQVYTACQAKESSSQPMWLVGKSMGARVAYRCVDVLREQGYPVQGAIAFGFPFHPPGKPEKSRVAELSNQAPRNLIIHGTRDPFGKPAWVENQPLPQNVMVEWHAGGDHNLRLPKSSGVSAAASWQQAAIQAAQFIRGA